MKTIPLPIFNSEIRYARVKDVGRMAKKHGFTLSKDYDSFCGRYSSGIFMIVLSYDAKPGDVSHECLHATNYVLNHIGHKISTDNDEVQAYLLGYIFEKVWAEFVKV
jgi:hypothetical protein